MRVTGDVGTGPLAFLMHVAKFAFSSEHFINRGQHSVARIYAAFPTEPLSQGAIFLYDYSPLTQIFFAATCLIGNPIHAQ